MKKVLLFGSIIGIGYSFFYFFKKQLNLALDFDYNLKNFSIKEITSDTADVNIVMEIRNKSSFKIILNSYDLAFYYENHEIAHTQSIVPVTIMPDSTFEVSIDARIDINEVKSVILPLLKNVWNKKPITVTANGEVDITFLGISHTVKLEEEEFEYSNNLLADLGLETKVDNLKNKASDLLGKIGLKI